MKKITIITLQNVRNYGSVLQALATQFFFESLGLEVDFINYLRENISSPAARAKDWCKGMIFLKKWIYTVLLYPTFLRQDVIFKKFLEKHLHVQPCIMRTKEDFARLSITSDIYCTGSDQTWNSTWNGGILPEVFLDFVPDNVMKISYAASIGKDKLNDWEKTAIKKFLQRYAAISVRENTAVEIIKSLGFENVVQVLDPTLQMSRDFWMSYALRPKEEPYLLIYQLNTNPEFDKYAKEFAERKGLKLLRLCARYDQIFKCGKSLLIPNVSDFISYIAYADCVITDSFHAVAFCVNLNTNFIAIYPNNFSSRLESILELTALQNRHLNDFSDFSYLEAMEIDFTTANAILAHEREEGLKFMRKIIQSLYYEAES
jgi:hypothetical protein